MVAATEGGAGPIVDRGCELTEEALSGNQEVVDTLLRCNVCDGVEEVSLAAAVIAGNEEGRVSAGLVRDEVKGGGQGVTRFEPQLPLTFRW